MKSIHKIDPDDEQIIDKVIKNPITDRRLGNVNFSSGINRYENESNMSSKDLRRSRNRNITNKTSTLSRSAVR